MKLLFLDRGWEDYTHWQAQDRKILKKINALIEECRRHPFTGTGKPEPLRGDLSGFWSRRITRVHRLVYRATEHAIEVAMCRFHS